jgi:hypothetical protein
MNAKIEAPVSAPTPVAAPAAALEPAAYNALVNSARLRDLRLVKSEFNLDAEGLDPEPSWKQVHTCELQQSHYDAENGLLVAWIIAEANCLKKRKKIISVKCRYLVVFEVDGAPDELIIQAFSRRVARFAAYPYFRAHFAELVSQAGVFLPPLPIIKERKIMPNIEQSKKILAKEGAQ